MLSSLDHFEVAQKENFRSQRRIVGGWLIVVSVLVFLMIILGGVTRLTGSGLSMVDWHPISGIFPPFSEGKWQILFAEYKMFPEYQQVNEGMQIAEFKMIFWIEFAHRLLGRFIAIFFFLPFLYFLFRRFLSRQTVIILACLFLLGAAQGFLGWFMVKSGLTNRPDVSQYRLAAHFGVAVLIYGGLFWNALSILQTTHPKPHERKRVNVLLWIFVPWLFFVMVSGAFVAGTNAGFSYNTFPLMDGHFIPLGIFDMHPLYINFFENTVMIQFVHRAMAIFTLLFALSIWFFNTRPNFFTLSRRYNIFLLTAVLQFACGVLAVLYVVPLPLGVVHQIGALLLMTMSLYCLHGSHN